jgi:thiol-disulfide isomerase/thioredoxin
MTTKSHTTGRRVQLVLALAVILALAVVLFAFGSESGEQAGAVELEGEPPPTFTFEYFDGGTGSLADFAGKPVVLNFWASWCPACVAEMPDFQAVHEELGDEVVFLGMDMQDISRAAALSLVESTGVDYFLADDPTGEIFRAFGGFSMPTTVFINSSGEIVDTHSGTIFAADLTAQINELFFLNG